MATSPPYAGSPPGGSAAPMSRKRPPLSSQISGAKRRKPSQAGPSHLRQTSFPPDEFPGGGRSPSIDSAAIVTPSVISGAGAGKRGKRGKSQSIILAPSSRVNDTGRGASASAVDAGGRDDEADDEEDDGDQQDNLQGQEGTAEQQEREMEAIRALKATFNEHQMNVFEQFNTVGKMMMPKIRKLANHTLSQSVPQSVVQAMQVYLKVFMGEVVEEARRVQIEWQAASDEFPDKTPVPADASLQDRTKEEWRGPLLPDHIREAVRRMKKNRNGGAAGFKGVSLAGKERTIPRMGGRRLFR